jgi:homogentisate 1,2-dioxygenase
LPHYLRVGEVPRKRHTLARGPAGRLSEELVSLGGFASATSLLYHLHSPSAVISAEPVSLDRPAVNPNSAVEPLHLSLPELAAPGGSQDAVTARRVLAGNANMTLCWVRARASSPLYRNAEGDELAFVYRGTAVVESVFGSLRVAPGDYVVIPASTTHRWTIDPGTTTEDGDLSLLVVEAAGHIEAPQRYLTSRGQLREGAPFCERDIRVPSGPLLCEDESVEVLVRHRGGWARHVNATHPFDVIGWDGCVYPFALSISDFEPIVGRLHQPPPVHQTFEGPGFVVCSFVPRPLDFDPAAVPIPYHHANVDCDEVLFYVDGDFTSRHGAGISAGSLTLHPAGFVHGPQPGSVEAALGRTRTDETAVMIDTFSPLGVTQLARDVADRRYLASWRETDS